MVEITKILNDRPFQGPSDLPAIGARVSGVVLGYTPNGQLRLSLLQRDIDRPPTSQAPLEDGT
jgi:hypothetical protein